MSHNEEGTSMTLQLFQVDAFTNEVRLLKKGNKINLLPFSYDVM
jgi:hypothetical protein